MGTHDSDGSSTDSEPSENETTRQSDLASDSPRNGSDLEFTAQSSSDETADSGKRGSPVYRGHASSSTSRTASFVTGHCSTRTTSSRKTESSVATNSSRKSQRCFGSRSAITGRQTSSSTGRPGRGSHSSRKPSARTSVESVTLETSSSAHRSQLPRPGYPRRCSLRTRTTGC